MYRVACATSHYHAVVPLWCVSVCFRVVSVSVFIFRAWRSKCAHGLTLQLTPVTADPTPKGERVCTSPASLLRPPRVVNEIGPELDSISSGRSPHGKQTHNLFTVSHPCGIKTTGPESSWLDGGKIPRQSPVSSGKPVSPRSRDPPHGTLFKFLWSSCAGGFS